MTGACTGNAVTRHESWVLPQHRVTSVMLQTVAWGFHNVQRVLNVLNDTLGRPEWLFCFHLLTKIYVFKRLPCINVCWLKEAEEATAVVLYEDKHTGKYCQLTAIPNTPSPSSQERPRTSQEKPRASRERPNVPVSRKQVNKPEVLTSAPWECSTGNQRRESLLTSRKRGNSSCHRPPRPHTGASTPRNTVRVRGFYSICKGQFKNKMLVTLGGHWFCSSDTSSIFTNFLLQKSEK